MAEGGWRLGEGGKQAGGGQQQEERRKLVKAGGGGWFSEGTAGGARLFLVSPVAAIIFGLPPGRNFDSLLARPETHRGRVRSAQKAAARCTAES